MTNLVEQKELEELLISDDFKNLTNISDKFNVFKVLKLENAEIRHSNFLGWLLNPCENHSTGDYFLKEFLKTIIKDHSTNPVVNISISDIVLNDFMDTEVTLEKLTDKGRRIDILLESKRNQFVCVIENKVWSDEGCQQLEDYYKYVNSHEKYKNYKYKLFVFLTPKTEYDCTQLYKSYIRFDYEKICKIIDKLLKDRQNIIEDDVKYFIENYKEMVERTIMGKYDKKVLELCAKIYKNYGQTIDLISQLGNPKACVLSVLEEVLKERNDLAYLCKEKHGFSFLPNNINNKESFYKDNSDKSIVYLNAWGYAWGCDELYLEIFIETKKDYEVNSERRNALISHIENKMGLKFIRTDEEHSISRTSIKENDLYRILTNEEYSNCKNRDEIKQKIKENLENACYIDKLRNTLNSWHFKN